MALDYLPRELVEGVLCMARQRHRAALVVLVWVLAAGLLELDEHAREPVAFSLEPGGRP
jgi:hypothetical protein